MKQCYKCGIELPIEMFDIKSSSKNGHDSICKKCKSKYNKEYREKNRDALREKAKQRRLENRDVINAKKKEYYQEHKDEILLKSAEYRREHKEQKAATDKKYAQENKEKIQKYQKEYREEHKLSNAEYQKQYRIKNKDRLDEYKKSPHIRYTVYQRNAKHKDRNFDLSEADFIAITQQPCVYCGEYSDTYNDELFNGIDRIDSDLGYSINNCVPCCATCNRMKMDLDVNDWIGKMKQIISHYNQ
jgi:hypothetical protein